MSERFYRRNQAELVAGSNNFSTLLSASPSEYGVAADLAAAYASLNAELQNSWVAATTPETRTPVTVELKDLKVKQVRTNASVLAKIIYATQSVTDDMLVALGLPPRRPPAPRPIPMTAPVVDIVAVVNRLVKGRLHAASGEGRRKEIGATAAQIFSYVGPTPPSDPAAYRYMGLTTRSTFEVQFPDDVPNGAQAWIAAAWVSSRGVTGIACAPVSVIIQGGPVLAAAA
jgi:hypothetical protein